MFRISNVEANINMLVDETFKLKPIKFFTRKKNLHRFENKGICGIILNCTSPTGGTSKVTSTSGFNAQKKQRTTYVQTRAYHRWFLCADALNPPHTFVIVTHTRQQTCYMLRHVHDSTFVGMPFYLVEPSLITSTLGDYLHILEHKGETMYPLRDNAKILAKPAPIDLPAGSEQTFYYVQENAKIALTRMKFSTDTCTGYQCDRHWGKDGCVCCIGSMGNALVYEFDFELKVDKKQFHAQTHIASLSSFKTMSVFFHNLTEYTHATTPGKEEKFLLRRRKQVRHLIHYVNEHGGWKIIGWCKRGLLSFNNEEKVENTDINLRLTSVYPQDSRILKSDIFKMLQIREDFEKFDHQLPNLPQTSSQSDSSDSDSDSDSNIDSDSDSDNDPKDKQDVSMATTKENDVKTNKTNKTTTNKKTTNTRRTRNNKGTKEEEATESENEN